MLNTHTRVLDHSLQAIRPWIERAWSGTREDVFPRDQIPTWRKNPEGLASSDLVVGATRMGHGPFAFTLAEWDGSRWRVEVAGGGGWHGFDLEPLGPHRTKVTHTLSVEMDLVSRALVIPMHDWAVESLLDRLEVALTTGLAPERTERPMAVRTSVLFVALRTLQRVSRWLRARSAGAAHPA